MDLPISGLPTASALSGAELIPIVQAGTTKQSTASAFLTYIGANITASNGLTNVSGNLKLGGALTGNTTITGNYTLNIGSALSTINSLYVNANWQVQHVVGNPATIATESYQQNNQFYLLATPDGYGTSAVIYGYSAGQAVANNGSNNNLIIEDTISSKGLVYTSDYSANFTPESLISKRWVTDQNYLIGNQNITITISGDVSATGSGTTSISMTSSIADTVVTGKVLTGLTITGGTIGPTDTILDAFGKLQNQVSAVTGAMNYQGTWNANTNSPTLASGVGTKGYVYRVTVSGSTNLDGITDWVAGDFAVYNGSTWDKWDATDAVTSVNGATGTVSLTGTSNRITVTGTSIDISSLYAGQNTITTLGTVTTGTWQGSAIADSYISSATTWNNMLPLTFTADKTLNSAGYNLILSAGANTSRLRIDATNATNPKILSFSTGSSPRWALRVDGAGDDLAVRRYDGSGTYIDSPISISRSTGNITLNRVVSRVTSITSSATPTVNTDNCDAVDITALATAITSMTTNLSGTPTNFQKLIFRIKDNGTARAITWGASFAAHGVALPTTTVISKLLTVGFIYDTTSAVWGCVAVNQEA